MLLVPQNSAAVWKYELCDREGWRLVGDTKLQSPTLENEIPAELKETQPVETVSMLDKRFEELLAEIKILTESRGKDFQKIEARVDRMPALPNINYFEKFKTLRKEKLDRASEIEIPAYKETASQAVVQEMNDAWNVDAILNGPNLLYTLKKFFRMKSMELLDVNSLLVSRWNRFCRSAADISKFLPSFQKYQEFLRGEYIDAVTRYEKISEQIEQRIKQRHMEQAAREAERIANERAGNVTMKNQEKAANTKLMNVAKEALKIKKISEKHQRDQAEREAKDMLEREKLALDDMDTSDDMINPGFDPEDITVYLRDVIGKCKGARDLNVYLSRAKLLTQSDRSSLLRDYKMLYSLKPGKNLPDIMNEYEGLNMFMEKPPQKVSKVEDFLTEFEILCAHFAVDTPISLEDGRPFVYEVDGRFASKFSEYLSETTHPPYESGESDINPATGGLGNAPSGGRANEDLDLTQEIPPLLNQYR
ncbi:hypothetical protein BC829DRAFT_281066 [Chytridium lagenaria]|nr:hypothetical protein BC829DRAFT_281066 [Chytridium lagenaria]